MISLSALLPLALLFPNLAQASILEDHDYQVMRSGTTDYVLFRDEYGQNQLLDMFTIYPLMGVSIIHYADNGKEPEHSEKLGLAEIYNALAEERSINLDEIDWVVCEADKDPEAAQLIRQIRQGRGLVLTEDVSIFPADEEWNKILDTKYFKQAAMVNYKMLSKIIIKSHPHEYLRMNFPMDAFYFYFPKWDAFSEPESTNNEEAIDEESELELGDESGNESENEWADEWAHRLQEEWKQERAGDQEIEGREGAAKRAVLAGNDRELASLAAVYAEVDNLISPNRRNDVASSSNS
ncbi:hypothetical protein Cpir12675_000607 [Ceratocystis pirilliformis]|uniref:Uncharacterized protein n=1 Tax=Ceratocystis pirilliformis TaxID=259994 RepID=A0ABR3ZMD9_9PEZI